MTEIIGTESKCKVQLLKSTTRTNNQPKKSFDVLKI